MNDPQLISVVVPTYNRGQDVLPTIESLLSSQIGSGVNGELIVVDDGSAPGKYYRLDGVTVPPHWALCELRKANGGPASARNHGLARARGAIVLFVDDDIVVGPGTVAKHIRGHKERPHSVIFGRCPFRPPKNLEERLVLQYLDSNDGDPFSRSEEEFILHTIVASGHLSIEREDFTQGVYNTTLQTPASEELELSARLKKQNYPVFVAPQNEATHNQPYDITFICRQQFKHGLGYAEAQERAPVCSELEQMRDVSSRLAPVSRDDKPLAAVRMYLKSLVSSAVTRNAALSLARLFSRKVLPRVIVFGVYRLAISGHFIAGYKKGIKEFSGPPPPN